MQHTRKRDTTFTHTQPASGRASLAPLQVIHPWRQLRLRRAGDGELAHHRARPRGRRRRAAASGRRQLDDNVARLARVQAQRLGAQLERRVVHHAHKLRRLPEHVLELHRGAAAARQHQRALRPRRVGGGGQGEAVLARRG